MCSSQVVSLWVSWVCLAGLAGPEEAGRARRLSHFAFREPFTELLLRDGAKFSDGKLTVATPEELQRMLMKYGAKVSNSRTTSVKIACLRCHYLRSKVPVELVVRSPQGIFRRCRA
jgi:hypothetical protein